MAVCFYCKVERTSSDDLPFFESRLEGTKAASLCATCGYYEVAHGYNEKRSNPVPPPATVGHSYSPGGAWPTDLFYCGCRGWD
jgi:hypothetical protein